MNRLIQNFRRKGLTNLSAAFLSKSVPTLSEPKIKNVFLPHVYGLEIKSHIFPNIKKTIVMDEEQIKFYKKVAPNYVVGLVKKVIDDASINIEEDSNKIQNKFYQVCIYCRIRYRDQNKVELQGLFRSKIDSIKQIVLENNYLPTSSTPTAVVQTPENEKMENSENEQTQFEGEGEEMYSQQALKSKSLSFKRHEKKQHTYYSLKVNKIEEIPLLINPVLEIKFKYLVDTFAKIFKQSRDVIVSLTFNNIDLPQTLDYIVNECTLNMSSKKQQIQECLEQSNHEKRIDLVQKLLQQSLHTNNYLIDIEREAKNKLRNKKMYEYYSEMMKITKEYLDGKKTKELFIEKCVKNFSEKNPPKQIIEVFDQELEKYQHMDENSMEAGVVKAYIQELSKIPYNVKSEESFDLDYAQKVLDEDHYGMKEVKEAILEVIAVGKLKTTLKGKIFCFIGGPGLGKTSFAKSVAKALNRKFYNISLGGVSDSSALKGHRRTYIGAYSGKIIEALKNCGTNNPVILLDEIDKMGSSHQGDPRSQLLEILDPNQNNAFVDNFLDVPVDLSNVLFITSANYEQNISKPLLDRMEKIKLTSYTKAEKIQIFKRHLLKRAILASGVSQEQFELSDETIHSLVEEYSRGEPGVRYLEKAALNILEKIAYKIVTEEEECPIKVDKESLNKYLGNSYFRLKDHNKISRGVAISLGGGSYGSRLTYIEAFKKSFVSRKQINRGILFTGSLGDVFKEAMNISYTYARNFLLENLQNKFLYENQVHLHAPEGASKKDGSTDSLTIVSALVSLAIQTKVKSGVALTGQLTLNGHILRTHGIKEKIIVAKRQKITEVIMPAENFADVDELSEELKEGIKFHFVNQFSEVFSILFPEVKMEKNEESSSQSA